MKIFPFAISLLIAMTTSAQTHKKSEGAVDPPSAVNVSHILIELEKELAEAFIMKDIAAIKRIEADDIVTTQDDGTTTTKEQDIANISSPDMKIESFNEYDFHVRVYGDTAVVTGQYIVKGANKGKDFHTTDRFTDVWRNEHGHWQLVVSQDTIVPHHK